MLHIYPRIQWRSYIDAKEATLGAPELKGPPNLYKKMAAE